MSSFNKKVRNFFDQHASIYSKPIFRQIVLGLAFFTVLMVLLSADFVPSKLSLKVGQVSDRDVVSPRTVSFIDDIKTKKLQMETVAGVANVYDLDTSVIMKVEGEVSTLFQTAHSIFANELLNSVEARKDKLKSTLPTVTGVSYDDEVFGAIAKLKKVDLDQAEKTTKLLLNKFFQRGIREGDLDFAKKNVALEVEAMNLDSAVENAILAVVKPLLQPNLILNVKETDKRRKAALASVEPVRQTIKKGQILVRRGDLVTDEQIRTAEEVGLLASHMSETRMIGLAIFLLAVISVFLGYIYKLSPQIFVNEVYLLLMSLIIILTLILSKATHYFSNFLAPVAVGALLTSILIDMRIGVLLAMATSLLFGIIVDMDFRSVAVALAGSLAGVYSVSKLIHGYSLTRAGVIIAAVNFTVIISTGLIAQIEYMQIMLQALWGIVGGIAAAVITIGLLPYLENTFHITTPISLLNLAKPNHPLLRQLLLSAPGTYHHSVLVGNMAETAADLVGADPITVRIGAYYHDVGKIKRPYFFIENQISDENPHDKIAPSLSTLIVTSHVKDGVDLCREYKIPNIIIDIVEQHHGTLLVSYFYRRATENEHSECIVEADFRYEGPRPQTKEAALVMLADACEAAVRSLSRPNINRIEATVRKLIRERLLDGQLDECNLTFNDLNIIGDVFIRLLSGTFHNRIEYSDVKDLERRNNKNANNVRNVAGKDNCNSGNGTNHPVSAKNSS